MRLFLKNLAFTILVPGTVAGLLPFWLFGPYDPLASGIANLAAGGGLIVAGLALYLACIWPFATIGRGTPAPIDAPVHLVVVGPYRFVRNPMYLAVLSVIFGQALVARSSQLALYGLAVGLLFGLFVVGYEELALRRQFGDEYTEYRQRVPRWIPRPPRKSR